MAELTKEDVREVHERLRRTGLAEAACSGIPTETLAALGEGGLANAAGLMQEAVAAIEADWIAGSARHRPIHCIDCDGKASGPPPFTVDHKPTCLIFRLHRFLAALPKEQGDA